MAVARDEDQIFFIFDHSALNSEEDDLKDAIVYFFPSSISVNSQCALVGQLMGMVDFFKSIAQSPPSIFTLHRNKIAIKHLGKYTLALAGNREWPDGVVLAQLSSLYKIFTFYQRSLSRLEQKCQKRNEFCELMQDIWDCYLPFVRRYGDNIAASFESLPVVDLSKNGSMLILKASHFLQRCQKEKGVLAGCILYRNRVLCSQFHPNITAKLLIIRPQQSHFPCCFISSELNPPAGVRLLKVHVSEDEYNTILRGTLFETSAGPVTPETLSISTSQPSQSTPKTQVKNDSPSKLYKHGRRFGSMDWNNTVQEFKLLAKDTAALSQKEDISKDNDGETEQSQSTGKNCAGFKSPASSPEAAATDLKQTVGSEDGKTSTLDILQMPQSPLHKSQSTPDMSNLESIQNNPETRHRSHTDSSPDPGSHTHLSRQLSRESNVICIDSITKAADDIEEEKRRTSSSTTDSWVNISEASVVNKPGTDQTHYVQTTTSDTGIVNPGAKEGTTVSLLKNIRRIASQSRTILENMTRQLDLNADMEDSDEEDALASYQETKQPDGETGPDQPQETQDLNRQPKLVEINQSNVPNQSVDISEIQEKELKTSCRNNTDCSDILSSVEQSQQSLSTKTELVIKQMNETGSAGAEYSQNISRTFQDMSNQGVLESQKADPGVSPEPPKPLSPILSAPEWKPDVNCVAIADSDDLIELDLYVQGNSDSVLLLLLERGSLLDGAHVSNLWRKSLSQMGEIEAQVQQLSDPLDEQDLPIDYNYLTYNNYTKNLSGKISMARGMLQPMSHHELDFCGTALLMHQEFNNSHKLQDLMLRSHGSCVYGHKAFSREMFFQPKECKAQSGIPSARDSTMCLDAKACEQLLLDQGITII